MVQLRSGPSRHALARPLSKDDLPAIGISRLRATGVVTPSMSAISINMGDGLERQVRLAHTQFPNGGGWSFFVCRQCDGLLYRCQHNDKETRIAHLRALLYGGPARHKPRAWTIDRRRSME